MSDDDIEALRQQTSQGDRIDEAAPDDVASLVDDIVEELEAIDSGEKQKTVSVWDGPLAAFIRALESNPEQMEDVGKALQEHLDIESENIDRSELLRLSLRVGFKTAAPEEFDAVRDGVQEHATRRL